jgi:hypothetical protein
MPWVTTSGIRFPSAGLPSPRAGLGFLRPQSHRISPELTTVFLARSWQPRLVSGFASCASRLVRERPAEVILRIPGAACAPSRGSLLTPPDLLRREGQACESIEAADRYLGPSQGCEHPRAEDKLIAAQTRQKSRGSTSAANRTPGGAVKSVAARRILRLWLPDVLAKAAGFVSPADRNSHPETRNVG